MDEKFIQLSNSVLEFRINFLNVPKSITISFSFTDGQVNHISIVYVLLFLRKNYVMTKFIDN